MRIRFATIAYDSKGRAISTQHAGGAEETIFTYNSDGTTDVTDALGTMRNHSFQAVLGSRKDKAITQPCTDCAGLKTSIRTYDVNGNLATKTDFNGVETAYL